MEQLFEPKKNYSRTSLETSFKIQRKFKQKCTLMTDNLKKIFFNRFRAKPDANPLEI